MCSSAGRTLPELTRLSVAKRIRAISRSLKLPGWRGEIADKIVKEICDAAAVPGRRRPRLPDARSQRRDALRRRSAAHPPGEPDRRRPGRRDVHPRRAVDRPAPARQPAPAAHAHAPARPRQHRDRGRARRGSHSRAPTTWSTSAPAPACTAGEIVAQGTPADMLKSNTARSPASTCPASRSIAVPKHAHAAGSRQNVIRIRGARGNNLKNVDVEIPLGLFTCVTGVSGSGKSTLVNDTLYAGRRARAEQGDHADRRAARRHRRARIWSTGSSTSTRARSAARRARIPPPTPACSRRCASCSRRPRRRARAATSAGRFSFNVKGGRCEACQGDGVIKVEMHFLPDIYVPCDVCKGRRYNRETLEIRYKGKNIHEVLRDDRRGRARVLRRRADDRAQAADADGRRAFVHSTRARTRPRCPAARRSA